METNNDEEDDWTARLRMRVGSFWNGRFGQASSQAKRSDGKDQDHRARLRANCAQVTQGRSCARDISPNYQCDLRERNRIA